MNKRTKRFIFVLAGAVLVILIALLGFVGYLFYSFPSFDAKHPHQSDELMISRFHEHREEFEELRAMAVADELMLSVDEDSTVPENLPTIRVTEYRRLFHRVGTPRGIRRYPGKPHIEFIASLEGWVASGSTKGYIYRSGGLPSGDIVDSLNDPRGFRVLDKHYLRQIADNWYLFFRHD